MPLIALAVMAELRLSIAVIIIGAIAIALVCGKLYGKSLRQKFGKAVTGDKNNINGSSASIAPYMRKAGEATGVLRLPS
ncbi:hypothetical protein GCM10011572_17590 [Pseudoduganella buxea]|uniref:Uncharacterized protein n=1 Tax=Pseudoduganella buxea TaxID=1949069 RepID=A0ABQ1KHL8_9BURK|nr:hypothetical protein GCM10011572_17590 [Pseudoduganella buxea]